MIIKIKNLKGFTLVELLIVSFISSIVIMGILQLLNLNQNTSLLQKEMINVQNSGFFITSMISSDLQKAGDFGEGTSKFDAIPFNFDKTLDNLDGNSQISILYNNRNNEFSCNGESGLTVIENTYKVSNSKFYCNDIEIVDNVKRFKILYGADINGDGSADRYVDRDTAKIVSEASDQRVVSVMFALVLSSSRELEEKEKKDIFILNDEKLTFEDGMFYRLFYRNVTLNNML